MFRRLRYPILQFSSLGCADNQPTLLCAILLNLRDMAPAVYNRAWNYVVAQCVCECVCVVMLHDWCGRVCPKILSTSTLSYFQAL